MNQTDTGKKADEGQKNETPSSKEAPKRWISATVNEEYTNDKYEGIKELQEGDTVVLNEDGTWYKV